MDSYRTFCLYDRDKVMGEGGEMMIAETELRTGVIFGDIETGEYVYMPGSEIGMDSPMCVYEEKGTRRDVDMEEALRLIRVRSLRPVRHPLLGRSSC